MLLTDVYWSLIGQPEVLLSDDSVLRHMSNLGLLIRTRLNLLALAFVLGENLLNFEVSFPLNEVDLELNSPVAVVLKRLRCATLTDPLHDLGQTLLRIFLVAHTQLIGQIQLVVERHVPLDVALEIVVGVLLAEDAGVALRGSDLSGGRDRRLLGRHTGLAVALPAANLAQIGRQQLLLS